MAKNKSIKIRRALISVSDKTGLAEFVKNLETLVAATIESTLLPPEKEIPNEYIEAAEKISEYGLKAYKKTVL